ncbi:MAG: epoxyqueuosine reductase [Bacilli bacterium]
MKKTDLVGHDFVGVISKEAYPNQSVFKRYPFVNSIIVLLFPYSNQTRTEHFVPAKMFYGRDYHLVVKQKLAHLSKQWELPDAVLGVDINPLDEKRCAYLAGLGTYGDHNLIINPTLGTFFAIGTMMTSAFFDKYDQPIAELCTHCGDCIRACPTQALDDGFNKQLCLSYLSQTNSQNFARYDFMKNSCYGCDLCQDACFFNHHPDWGLPELAWDGLSVLSLDAMLKLNFETFLDAYQQKSWNWIGYDRMLRNIMVVKNGYQKLTNQEVEQIKAKILSPWFLNHLQYLRGQHGKS